MTFLFIVGFVLLFGALILPKVIPLGVLKPTFLRAGQGLLVLIGIAVSIFSTGIYVEDNQGGLVIKRALGGDLQGGKIIAINGENGPQAKILPPGLHLWYLPFIYKLEPVESITIPDGYVGVVSAKDGKALPNGEIYAPDWTDPRQMIDGEQFLSGEGYAGPQITVLRPAQYRYNPRLFKIVPRKYLSVPVGKVAVIKSNAGPIYVPKDGEEVVEVNGTPIVPKGYRGIWNEALTPNSYYLHPDAYEPTFVSTTNRVYEYTGKHAINVKTKDGFEFPVDIRVAIKISAKDAPFVVAKFAKPDDDLDKDGFSTIEDRAILPTIRTIIRNNAETRGALEYLASRSDVERSANESFEKAIRRFKIQSDGVFVADIGLDHTKKGKELLATQTDREIAIQKEQTYIVQEKTERQRASVVRATEEANQEKQKAISRAQIIIKENEGKALRKFAEEEAKAWLEKINALGGVENFNKLEMLKIAMKKWNGDVPRVMTSGGSGGDMTAMLGIMIEKAMREQSGKK